MVQERLHYKCNGSCYNYFTSLFHSHQRQLLLATPGTYSSSFSPLRYSVFVVSSLVLFVISNIVIHDDVVTKLVSLFHYLIATSSSSSSYLLLHVSYYY